MAKQKGRLMLVKQGDGASTESFYTLCGLIAKTISINNEEIDVTTADCTSPGGPLWTEVLDGVKRISVSGNGFFEDSVQELRANTVAMATPPICNQQIILPGLGTFAGAFFMASLEWGGEVTGGVTYAMSLASTGPVTFTAS